jgi:A/G-specific adenine glycosylase
MTLNLPIAPELLPDTAALLDWYDRHRRRLPWRAEPGEAADPYAVWLSEIMLQQTTVATVRGYFDAFMARWPRVTDLAAASLDEILHAWQGLGYYARARNLHACAKVVANAHGGVFPDTEDGLRALPGIGAYTAAAIAAIAFGRKATVVDGNVERVMARLFRVATPLPDAKAVLRDLAARLTPHARAGDYAQGVMDLGATVCTPRRPDCPACPWRNSCHARAAGDPESFPRKRAKAPRPTRYGTIFWLECPDGRVMLRRRPENGLLGGLVELPSTPWEEAALAFRQAQTLAPLCPDSWRELPGCVVHAFTHFRLELVVAVGTIAVVVEVPGAFWVHPRDFSEHALPTVMKKVVRHRFGHSAGSGQRAMR